MRIRNLLILLPTLLLLLACAGKEGMGGSASTTTYKVAVVMPRSLWDTMEPVAEQALKNLASAQEGLSERIAIELEWIDEDTPDLDDEVYRIMNSDSYAAVVGPKYSRHARNLCRESLSYRIPVFMPSVTSAEIQRIFGGSNRTAPNVFCMTESDLAQCQALLSVISRQMWVSRVVLITHEEEDDYTTSFSSYLPFMATELKFSKVQSYRYSDKESLRAAVREINEQDMLYKFVSGILFVPSTVDDMVMLDEVLTEEEIVQDDGFSFPRIYCPDLAHSDVLDDRLKNEYEGIALSGSPESGFPAMRQAFSGHEIQSGYAQFYDCITLLGLSLTHMEAARKKTLREAVVEVMDACDGDGDKMGWTPESLYYSIHRIRDGHVPSMAGASGSWVFDRETHVSQLGSWYGHWRYYDGRYHFVEYLTRSDHANKTSMDQLWNMETSQSSWEKPIIEKDIEYGPLQDRFAVVMATSTGFINYRHQADALEMYRLIKQAGYDDDHIILITEDDIASDPSNPHPGVVHVTPDGENLHQDFENDYKISQLTPADLANILSGTVTERTPKVLKGSANSNVLFFWSGHGTYDKMLNWGEGRITADEIYTALEGAEGNFRKMLLVMETCYSGSIGEDLPDIPGLLMLTACAPGESSHADILEGNIYLSNAFTRVFRDVVTANPDVVLYDLYTELARHTTASHAMMYNYDWYGSVLRNTAGEFFKPMN